MFTWHTRRLKCAVSVVILRGHSRTRRPDHHAVMCACTAVEAAELQGGGTGISTACEQLLLKHLAADAGRLGEPGNAAGAIRFVLARSFAEAACALDKSGADDDAQRDALLRHRRMADQLPRGPEPGAHGLATYKPLYPALS